MSETTAAPVVLPVAVRGWIERQPNKVRAIDEPAAPKATKPLGDEVLVIDTETAADFSQRLLVGSYRHLLGERIIDEGLVVPDDAPVAAQAIVDEHAKRHLADLPAGWSRFGIGRRLRVLSRTAFLRRIFYPVAYARLGTVVGFNLPFDLSRLASWWADDRAGGWYLSLLGAPRGEAAFHDWPGCPGLHLAPRGELAWQIEFRSQSPKACTWVPCSDGGQARKAAVAYGPDGRQYRGRFVDLAQVL
jgi:hypothetical protein